MRAAGRQLSEVMQVLAQRLPVGAVRPAGGMGEIGALGVQGGSTNHRQCASFSKTSEYGNPVLATRLGRPGLERGAHEPKSARCMRIAAARGSLTGHTD